MGNCTVTIKKRSGLTPTGDAKIVDIALSSSYATGGDTVTLASLGIARINMLSLASSATTATGHVVEVIHGAAETTAPKLRVRDSATGVEITNTTDLSAQTVRALVVGELANI